MQCTFVITNNTCPRYSYHPHKLRYNFGYDIPLVKEYRPCLLSIVVLLHTRLVMFHIECNGYYYHRTHEHTHGVLATMPLDHNQKTFYCLIRHQLHRKQNQGVVVEIFSTGLTLRF